MYNERNTLFSSNRLDNYLHTKNQQLHIRIEGLTAQKLLETDENALIAELVNEFTVTPPVLEEAKKDIEAHEGMVTVWGSGFMDDGPHEVKGIQIKITIPFTGDGELFHMRASTWEASGKPEGTVQRGLLILRFGTAEKEPEAIKQLWQSDVSKIQRNLAWIAKDLEQYNNSVQANVKSALTSRKKEAGNNQSLIDSIKLG